MVTSFGLARCLAGLPLLLLKKGLGKVSATLLSLLHIFGRGLEFDLQAIKCKLESSVLQAASFHCIDSLTNLHRPAHDWAAALDAQQAAD